VGGVEDDVFDGVLDDVVGGGFGEVETGDLEAVEEQAGAAGVDVVGRDALEDFADGVLDGAAVFGLGDGEVGRTALSGLAGDDFSGSCWAARGVVVVAEGLVAQARTAAAAAVDVDVAALEAAFAVVAEADVGLELM
jgi:hypothetical protein